MLRKCPIPVLMVRDGDWKHQRRILVAVNVSGEQEYQDEFNQELVSTGMNLAENLNRGNVHLVAAYPVAPINMAMIYLNLILQVMKWYSWSTPYQYESLTSKIWY